MLREIISRQHFILVREIKNKSEKKLTWQRQLVLLRKNPNKAKAFISAESKQSLDLGSKLIRGTKDCPYRCFNSDSR